MSFFRKLLGREEKPKGEVVIIDRPLSIDEPMTPSPTPATPSLSKAAEIPAPVPAAPRIVEVAVVRNREVTIKKAGSPDEEITFRRLSRPLGRVIFEEGQEPWGDWNPKVSPVANYWLLAERKGLQFIRQRILSS